MMRAQTITARGSNYELDTLCFGGTPVWCCFVLYRLAVHGSAFPRQVSGHSGNLARFSRPTGRQPNIHLHSARCGELRGLHLSVLADQHADRKGCINAGAHCVAGRSATADSNQYRLDQDAPASWSFPLTRLAGKVCDLSGYCCVAALVWEALLSANQSPNNSLSRFV